jgi:AraC-like DNA-binding protein
METWAEMTRRQTDEKQAILEEALTLSGGKINEAADRLGMGESTYRERFRRLTTMTPAEFIRQGFEESTRAD